MVSKSEFGKDFIALNIFKEGDVISKINGEEIGSLDELEEKTEHLNVLYNNVNKIDDQVRDIKWKCNEIIKGLKWSNKVFNERVKNLNDNLSKAYKELNRELEELERINQKSIYQIDQQINELSEWLWIDEYNLTSEREAIRAWILEVYKDED